MFFVNSDSTAGDSPSSPAINISQLRFTACLINIIFLVNNSNTKAISKQQRMFFGSGQRASYTLNKKLYKCQLSIAKPCRITKKCFKCNLYYCVDKFYSFYSLNEILPF